MLQTILFDLDDTLLYNSIDHFLPEYLDRLGRHMENLIQPERLIGAILAGTQAMRKSADPEITLQQAFDCVFFSMVDVDPETLRQEIDRFYTSEFSALQHLTSPVPAGKAAVELAFDRRLKVAIATNPVFPRTAIDQRIRWADLNEADFPFDLVTSYECLHFTKPRPEFFAEVLALTGCPTAEALMVGNDWEEDIAPALALGIAAYHIPVPGSTPLPGKPGSWDGLRELLRSDSAVTAFTPPSAKPDSLPAILTGNLAACLRILQATGWRTVSAEEGWGALEISCHLRDYEREILQPRIRMICTESNPYLPAIESDRWSEKRHYNQQDPHRVWMEYAAARKETIALLKALTESDWRKAARHAVLGPTTLEEQIRFAARHDLLHIEQLRSAYRLCDNRK